MVTTEVKLTFTEFLEQYPDGYGIYELVDGQINKLQLVRAHKNVARFLLFAFNDEIRRSGLDYIVDKDIIVRTFTTEGVEQGRNPDERVVSPTFPELELTVRDVVNSSGFRRL